MAAPDAWRCEWKKLDPRGRGSIPFEHLPQLLDGLGVDLSDDELEDAATRIQRWQASRLLLQGFLIVGCTSLGAALMAVLAIWA